MITHFGLIFVLLNLLDMALTYVLLSLGMVEANPVWGMIPLWAKPTLALMVVALVRSRRVMRGVTAGMALVCTWNLLCLGVA